MLNSNYIKIFTGSFITVQRIISELEKTGIIPVVKDESESGRLAGFGPSFPGQQELYVHKDELDKAVEIVETINADLKI
ncbi:putative signal transducing protein [Gelatiniphilus marinus]|uniref:Signal transducing protein n=1 Tax=Gelatiniphilus marinus TaxID=1759464 RepID=A0ABW5JPI1_9FLAO